MLSSIDLKALSIANTHFVSDAISRFGELVVRLFNHLPQNVFIVLLLTIKRKNKYKIIILLQTKLSEQQQLLLERLLQTSNVLLVDLNVFDDRVKYLFERLGLERVLCDQVLVKLSNQFLTVFNTKRD